MISIHDERIQKYLTPYKYTRPVLTGSGIKGAFDEQAVDIPFVFWHGGLYHMLYTGFDGTGYQSALAVSDDLLNWKHKGMVLTRDLDSGRWDGIGGAATWMIKESDSLWDIPKLKKVDGKYWLVYHSYPGMGYEDGPAQIGLAWCEDEELLDWHRLDEPVFSWKDGEEWEAGGLYKACVIEHEGLWYMFYNAKNREARWTEQTGLATSRDLLHWERCRENPVLRVTEGAWDERFVSDPYVVRDGDMWINFYFGLGPGHAQEGLALSTDLIHWEKADSPILTHGKPGELDCTHAHKPSMLYADGRLYHFYCGTRPWQEGDPAKIYQEFRTLCVASDQPFTQGEHMHRETLKNVTFEEG
ncbi:hypothetical protein [Murimonas intestini]|uniref:Glycosyl hydrolase family 32 n=1 Tax=Murimonas intestini TaxID=1337051 RepID=A0AB73T7E1_9FIRM|nr:hypothetical protein [Murimonas intestini]MCR1841302.1 hypothetical protein [Murimonas intestini]MCR1866220.1 hypothetical protein [Murimonas intestini]MCR1882663.1 hypothetical protein [Murimonas intestini]